MAANAPYYQIRSGQFITTPNSTNATPARLVVEDDEYAAIPSPHEHHPPMYSEHTARQTSADAPMQTMEENHNLAELLMAATTAAGHAAQAMDAHDAFAARTAAHGEGKRKRASSSPVEGVSTTPQADAAVAPKRQRVHVPTDPRLQSSEHDPHGNSENNTVPPSSESLLNDAGAAGVHSAAALFRRSTEKTSRKYTRPPMSKLFMSLQLSPENFLQLQALAKAYMLDTTFPERQNCVGNRGKGDTDMVKLRLFNCVRDFLNHGIGEEFFGEDVEKPGERDTIEAARALGQEKAPITEERLTWPRDGNKIISLVTPLMRRMVTNERQRMYAIETRKGGMKKKDKEGSAEAGFQHAHGSPSGNSARGHSIEQFDPSLGRTAHTSQPTSPLVLSPVTPSPSTFANVARQEYEPVGMTDLELPTDGPSNPSILEINIFIVLAPHVLPSGTVKAGVKINQKRIKPQGSENLNNYPWDDFLHEVITLLNCAKARYPAVRERLVPYKYRFNGGVSSTMASLDNLALRDVAAAANAIHDNSSSVDDAPRAQRILASPAVDDTTSSDRTGTDFVRALCAELGIVPSEIADTNDTHFEALKLPRFVIKTLGLNGWEFIETAEQWWDLLCRRSQDIWADGIVNMIVELVDIPVPMESVGGSGEKEDMVMEEGKKRLTEV